MDVKPYHVEGTQIINLTPHPLVFGVDGPYGMLEIAIPASGYVVRAVPEERLVARTDHAAFIKTDFVPDQRQRDDLQALAYYYPDAVLIGSRLAAEAYPGLVAAIVPHPRSRNYKDPHTFSVFAPPVWARNTR